jgi:NADH:ubiquinone oxidoreductase subunit 5 (subunit L)/multisubunit Na+/H+ antiporter MnhA subunit
MVIGEGMNKTNFLHEYEYYLHSITEFQLGTGTSANTVTFISICLLIASMAKNSQVGSHVWLPMAVEGPIRRNYYCNNQFADN